MNRICRATHNSFRSFSTFQSNSGLFVNDFAPFINSCLVIYSWGVGTNGQLGHAKFEMSSDVFGKSYIQHEPRKLLKSKKFSQLAVGEFFSLGVTYDGMLYGWGTGLVNFSEKQSTEIREPLLLPTEGKVAFVAAGTKHAAYVDTEGRVFTWGYGGRWLFGGGQLGHGTNDAEIRPRMVTFLKDYGVKVSSVSCGGRHTLFLTDDGEVLCCGVGEYGLIGNGDTSDAKLPVSLDSLENVVITQIAAGFDHSLALTNEGKVYSWGRNHQGQLGHSDSYMDMYSLENLPRQIEVENEVDHERGNSDNSVKFKQIAAGNGRSAAVSKDGQLYVWGSRLTHRPKLIDPATFDKKPVIKVACGGDSTRSLIAVVTEDNKLWTLGDFSSGMLGEVGRSIMNTKRTQPQKVPYFEGKKVVDVFTGLGQHVFAKVEVEV